MDSMESYKMECKINFKMLKPRFQALFPEKLYMELHPMGQQACLQDMP